MTALVYKLLSAVARPPKRSGISRFFSPEDLLLRALSTYHNGAHGTNAHKESGQTPTPK